MSLKGTLIKNLIGIGEALVSESNHVSAQEKTLNKLLEKAKDTAFGKFYGFDKILASKNIREEFAGKVPYFDYDKMTAQWWHKTQKGVPDISWPGKPVYFALSSGTTGISSKRIPITGEMLDAIRKAGIKQVAALSNFDLPPDFFEREILMLGSSTNLQENSGRVEGEISGIGASNIPFWFRGYYRPGDEIAKIDDWDERLEQIARNAKDWDIGALSGIPSWMELLLKKVIAFNNVENIHEIWPNLQVYASGGVAFEAYEKSFNSLLGKPIVVIDTYLASEGFLACQTRPGTTSMQLLTDNGIYFEFVPFKPEYINEDGSLKEEAPCKNLEEVKTGEEYVLVISTVSGAWRYLIGDTIEFTDVEKAEIKITGRTKFFLNVVGSQLSVNKMNDAILKLEKQFNLKIPEFTVSAIKIDGEYHHKWYLGLDSTARTDETLLAEALDNALKNANKNYAVARSKALKGVVVKTLPVDVFYEWSAFQKKKGGQVKTEKVMKEERFLEWEEFVENETVYNKDKKTP
jgi:hypothetical protein